MKSIALLIAVTLCYASYNLFVKASGNQVAHGTSPILATISLQLAALGVSCVYLMFFLRGGVAVSIPGRALAMAVAAGLCIGLAEVLYFYLFRGFAGEKPVSAGSAIPFVVGGTIAITVLVSLFVFHESMGPMQWLGVGLAFAGMMLLLLGA